jgi:hypothetical protein
LNVTFTPGPRAAAGIKSPSTFWKVAPKNSQNSALKKIDLRAQTSEKKKNLKLHHEEKITKKASVQSKRYKFAVLIQKYAHDITNRVGTRWKTLTFD